MYVIFALIDLNFYKKKRFKYSKVWLDEAT